MKKKSVNVGMIGYRFMGKAHSNAWRQVGHFFDLPVDLRLRTVCGRSAEVEDAAKKLGWERAVKDWREVVEDPEIDVVDICTPNDSHCEIALAAMAAGKAVVCEKPLALDAAQARKMADAAQTAGVPNLLCHNYRGIPAVALAKQMVEEGLLGETIYHFRARYAQDWLADPQFPFVWRLDAAVAGSGANGDINAHIIDLMRHLVGGVEEVSATERTFVKTRAKVGGGEAEVTVDDAVAWIGKLAGGGLANGEATRFAHGRKNQISWEINGSHGSLFFDFEDMNRLHFYDAGDPANRRGFRDILVTEREHPYGNAWWPPGHITGYEHTFANLFSEFVSVLAGGRGSFPTFEDGWENQKVLDAIRRSAQTRSWEKV